MPAPPRDTFWRSVLADDRGVVRDGLRHRAAEHPAHADLDVVRLKLLDLVALIAGPAEAIDHSGRHIAEVQVAVGDFQLQVRSHVVGQTCVQRPGEIALVGVADRTAAYAGWY